MLEATAVLLVGLVMAGGSGPETEKRTWLDHAQQHRVEAQFVDFAEGVVFLKRASGAVTGTAFDKLSSGDQTYVREQIAHQLTHSQAVRQLQLLGGEVLMTDDPSAAPVVTVHLGATRLSDEGLRHVAALKPLRKFVIYATTNMGEYEWTMGPVGAATLLRSKTMGSTPRRDSWVTHLRRQGVVFTPRPGATRVDDAAIDLLAQVPFLESVVLGVGNVTNLSCEIIGTMTQLRCLGIAFAHDVDLSPLRRLSELRALVLAGVQAAKNDGLGTISSLSQLEVLVVIRSSVGHGDLTRLQGLSKLQVLDLRGTKEGYERLRGVAGLAGLRTLYAGDVSFGNEQITDIENLKNLETLDLTCSWLDDAALSRLWSHPTLRSLCLFGVSKITDNGLAGLSEKSCLQALDLGDTNLSANGLRRVATLPHLRELHLDDTAVDDSVLQQLGDCKALEVLNLATRDPRFQKEKENRPRGRSLVQRGQITDGGMVALRKLQGLKELDLSSESGVGDQAMTTVATWTHLRVLRLSGLTLTNDGLGRLAPLEDLEELDLNTTNIFPWKLTDPFGKKRSRGFGEYVLVDKNGATLFDEKRRPLVASNIRFTGDDGLQNLARMTKLKVLDLRFLPDPGRIPIDWQVDVVINGKRETRKGRQDVATNERLFVCEHFAKLRDLEVLHLGEVPSEALETVTLLPNLKLLSVGIQREGLKYLRGNENLKALVLHVGGSVGQQGIDFLASAVGLDYLFISANDTGKIAKSLRNKRPSLNIKDFGSYGFGYDSPIAEVESWYVPIRGMKVISSTEN